MNLSSGRNVRVLGCCCSVLVSSRHLVQLEVKSRRFMCSADAAHAQPKCTHSVLQPDC